LQRLVNKKMQMKLKLLIWGQEQEVRFWGDSSIRKSKRSKITLQDCR
jgi:hypothetical protein